MRAAWLVLLMVAICSDSNLLGQAGYGKSMRKYRKVSRSQDPEVLESNLRQMISELKDGSVKRFNLKVYYSTKLADLCVRTGRLPEAERILLDRISELEARPLKWSTSLMPFFEGSVFECYDRLGYLYLITGNFRKAEENFSRSSELRESIYPRRSVHRILPTIGMGSLAYRRGQYEETFLLFAEAAVAMRKATSTHYDYDYLSRIYLTDMIELCFMLGRYDEAWTYIRQLSIASSGINKFGSRLAGNLETARVFELKARYYLLTGNYPKAQQHLNYGNEYYSSKVRSSDVGLKLLKAQAVLHWHQDHYPEASQAFLALIDSYRLYINNNFLSMSEYEKERFYNSLKSDYSLFNAFALSLPEDKSHPLFEAMYNNALNTKALLLNESNKIKNRIVESGNATLIEKLDEWESSKTRLASYYYDKSGVTKIDSLERRIEQLEKEINGETALFAGLSHPVDWKQIQAALKPEEAAVEIIRVNTVLPGVKAGYGPRFGLSDSVAYLALIVRPGLETPDNVVFHNGNDLERKNLSYYRNTIMAQAEDRRSYDLYWTPLKRLLQGAARVYYSPDGVFNQINLNTLVNPKDNTYILDEVELSYVTNTGDLLGGESELIGREAVLFGRPDYDTEVVVVADSTQKVYGTRSLLTEELSEFTEQKFSDLPGTELEVSQIGATLERQNVPVRIFTGVNAAEANVKAVDNPGILHIATHGFFVADAASTVNPMIRSGLVLAGVGNRDNKEGEDGVLTAYEATNLKLDATSLVVLSACETGVGEVRNGEGVYGLQRAIAVAGADNLLMSLWKVDDQATASLMIELYKRWGRETNQNAFREAQRSLRVVHPQPFYWGAFIMLGR